MNCPCTGVNISRFVLSVIVGFVFIYGFDYLIHVEWLMNTYEQTPELWRPEDTMTQYFPWMMLCQFLTVVFVGFIYTRKHEGKGLSEGIRFGIMIGLLIGTLMMIPYAYLPISLSLALSWGAAGFGTGLGLGMIFSLIYKD